MKVGLVCPYNIFGGGGVQEVVLALQAELSKRGHDAKIITPLHRNFRDSHLNGTIFIGTSTDVKSLFNTTAQVSVSLNTDEIDSMLAREQFDLLHFHEPWVPIMSRQLLLRSKAKNIATFHAKLPESYVAKTIERVITPYTRSVLRRLDKLTAVSDAAAEYVRTLTPKSINIIPNGINLGKYKVTAKNPTKHKTILYVGRLEKRKGVKYLLNAFNLLANNYPSYKLIIAGAGPEKDKLEDYAASLNLDGVSFKGYVNETEKLKLLAKADLFSAPALFRESFGIVLLEAMASGVVIVAGNNSGYTSVLRGKGALSIVNPKDSAEFARRLELLLNDETMRNVWKMWAKDYVKQFDYKKVATQYETLYLQSLGSS